jgi:hypothetical protein
MPDAVPLLPQMRELALEDRALVEGLLARDRPDASELTFTNLFLWRHAYGLRLSRVEGALCLFAWRRDPEDSFLLPPLIPAVGAAGNMSLRGSLVTEESSAGDRDSSLTLAMTGSRGSGVIAQALRHFAANGHDPKLCRISTAQLGRLGITSERFVIEPDRDNWDYVYSVRDLAELAGDKYHQKRNHIAQFRSQYDFEYRPLTPDLVAGCEEVQDLWCDERHCDLSATLRAEARAVKEALRNLERLSAVGGCILIQGEVEAFTLGEALNDDTVTIHLEKANAAFHGLYQLINQQFLEHQWQDFAYVNRQQDLGIEGLRKAKLSYHPHHMVEKHAVRLKG